jgi:hypothetical protein
MIAFVVLCVAIGVIIGLAIAAFLDRATAKAPSTNTTTHSALGFDMNGGGGPDFDPRYVRMVDQVLREPKRETAWRTLLP